MQDCRSSTAESVLSVIVEHFTREHEVISRDLPYPRIFSVSSFRTVNDVWLTGRSKVAAVPTVCLTAAPALFITAVVYISPTESQDADMVSSCSSSSSSSKSCVGVREIRCILTRLRAEQDVMTPVVGLFCQSVSQSVWWFSTSRPGPTRAHLRPLIHPPLPEPELPIALAARWRRRRLRPPLRYVLALSSSCKPPGNRPLPPSFHWKDSGRGRKKGIVGAEVQRGWVQFHWVSCAVDKPSATRHSLLPGSVVVVEPSKKLGRLKVQHGANVIADRPAILDVKTSWYLTSTAQPGTRQLLLRLFGANFCPPYTKCVAR